MANKFLSDGWRHLEMGSQENANLCVTLKCIHTRTEFTADAFNIHMKFSPVESKEAQYVNILRNKEFFCKEAVLQTEGGTCHPESNFSSQRTEIQFHIVSVNSCDEIEDGHFETGLYKRSKPQAVQGSDSEAADNEKEVEMVTEIHHEENECDSSGNITLEEKSNLKTETSADIGDSGTVNQNIRTVESECRNEVSLSQCEREQALRTCQSCMKVFQRQEECVDHESNCKNSKHTSLDESSPNSPVKVKATEKKFDCTKCGKVFNKLKALRRHNLNHHSNISVYICNICKKGYTDGEALRYHVFTCHKDEGEQVETSNQQYKCYICPRTFIKRSLLKNHLLLHKNGKPYRCQHCGITFTDDLAYELHKEIHKGEAGKPFTCKNCEMCFSTLTLLKKHKASHAGEIYKCDACDKVFKSGKSLRDHLNIHKGIRTYICNICGKALVSATQLKSHVKIHLVDKPYKCDACEKSFINPGDLTNHRRVHTGEKPFSCQICGKGFAYKTSLPRHMLVHSDQKPFKCDLCSKEFVSSVQMYNHKKTHLGLKNFICEVCGKRFTTGKALKVHSLLHDGFAGYKCEVCGKVYRNVHYLEIHKKTHTGKNLLQCHMCGDSFADPTYFKRHQKEFCKTILTYCEICNRGFPNNNDLKSHMGFHNGERPHGCDICGKAFAKSVYLSDHMKRHNPEALIGCSICGKGFINKKEVRRHEARHKNINKKRSSPRVAITNDQNHKIQEVGKNHSYIPKSYNVCLEASSTSGNENHEQVLQEYVESIENIKKTVIQDPPGYEVARPASRVNTALLPPGAGPAEEPPQALPTRQPITLSSHDNSYYNRLNPNQPLPGQNPDPLGERHTFPAAFSRENGEMVLMQEGLAAILNQSERNGQTYTSPQMQYYYPASEQQRYQEADALPKY